jgi:hypothetical protein
MVHSPAQEAESGQPQLLRTIGRQGRDLTAGIYPERFLVPNSGSILEEQGQFGSEENIAGSIKRAVLEGNFQAGHQGIQVWSFSCSSSERFLVKAWISSNPTANTSGSLWGAAVENIMTGGLKVVLKGKLIGHTLPGFLGERNSCCLGFLALDDGVHRLRRRDEPVREVLRPAAAATWKRSGMGLGELARHGCSPFGCTLADGSKTGNLEVAPGAAPAGVARSA